MTEQFLQYGGDHYKKAGHLQHWDMVAAMGHSWEYYVDRSAAYLTRIKDTALDPKKAGHFIDKLLDLIDYGQLPATYSPRPTLYNSDPGFGEYMTRYFAANSINPNSLEARAIVALMLARSREDLVRARKAVARFEGLPNNSSREAETPTPEETLSGTWPLIPPPSGNDFARDNLNVEKPLSGGGGDFGGGGATASYADDRVFVVADTSSYPMPAETCSRSDYSSSPAPAPSSDYSSSDYSSSPAPAPSSDYSSGSDSSSSSSDSGSSSSSSDSSSSSSD